MFQWVIEKFLVRYKNELWFKIMAMVVSAIIVGLEVGIQSGAINGNAEWFARIVQAVAVAKAFLSQIGWNTGTTKSSPNGLMTFFAFMTVAAALSISLSSFKPIEVAPAPSYERYGFLKESQGFHQAMKVVADELCVHKISGIATTTVDPTEIANLKLAKVILSGGANSTAFNFVLSECFTPSTITNLNDYNYSRDEFYNALDAKFNNLSERW